MKTKPTRVTSATKATTVLGLRVRTGLKGLHAGGHGTGGSRPVVAPPPPPVVEDPETPVVSG